MFENGIDCCALSSWNLVLKGYYKEKHMAWCFLLEVLLNLVGAVYEVGGHHISLFCIILILKGVAY